MAPDHMMTLFKVQETTFRNQASSPKHETHDHEPKTLKEYANGPYEANHEAFLVANAHKGGD